MLQPLSMSAARSTTKVGATRRGISYDIVRSVAHALGTRGFDVARYISTRDEVPMVDGAAADALFDTAARELDDPALGLTIARSVPMGSLGVLDYGLCTSATVRDALRLVVRYYGVATQRVRLELDIGPEIARVWFHRMPGIDHSRHWIEFSFGIFVQRFRDSAGVPLSFPIVSFQHAAPSDATRHREVLGPTVEFGAAADCLAFETHALDLPMMTASRSLVELLESRMRELAPLSAPEDPLLTRIRHQLSAMLGEQTSGLGLDALAARLRMSRRSLQRSLQALHTSHTQLLEDARRERATHLLREGKRVAEVAQALGFSEPSAFFRAYRRWTGTSPKSARAASA
jgi:AraC-like DNA-binding protein